MSKNAPEMYETNENFIYTNHPPSSVGGFQNVERVGAVTGVLSSIYTGKEQKNRRIYQGKLWPGPEEKDNHCNISDTDELPLTE